MVLYIGGAGQQKGLLAMREENILPEDTADGAAASDAQIAKARLIDHVHLLVRRCLQEEKSIEALETRLAGKVLICDEVGCGIIPLDAFEQRFREETGRLCCRLAAQAERVVRVHCGIGILIKGER